MKPILLVQDGRTWAVHVRLGAVLPRRAKKAFPRFSPDDTLILVKTPDGKLDFVRSGEGGKAAKFSKEDAKHLAHKIGRYKLDLGDMVFAYTEERPDRSGGRENEPSRDARRGRSRRDAPSAYVYKVDGPVSYPIEYHKTPEEALRAASLMVHLSVKDRAFGLERLREGKPFRYNYGFSEVEITPKPKRKMA